MTTGIQQNADGTIQQSLQEYARGIAGGLLFSLPLIYTMEVWWAGVTFSPLHQLAGLAACYVLLLGYNRYAGLRSDASFWEVAIDSVEELGIGLVISAAFLWLLGQIDSSMTWPNILGRVTLEALCVAIGVSVGTAQLGTGGDEGTDDEAEDEPLPFGGQVIIALCGAVLISASIAPTEEVIVIAFESTPQRLITLAALSFGLCVLVLYYSDFRGAKSTSGSAGWSSIFSGSCITYACALAAAAALLWYFGRYDSLSVGIAVSATVVLAAAASLGASAGRLLLQAVSS